MLSSHAATLSRTASEPRIVRRHDAPPLARTRSSEPADLYAPGDAVWLRLRDKAPVVVGRVVAHGEQRSTRIWVALPGGAQLRLPQRDPRIVPRP